MVAVILVPLRHNPETFSLSTTAHEHESRRIWVNSLRLVAPLWVLYSGKNWLRFCFSVKLPHIFTIKGIFATKVDVLRRNIYCWSHPQFLNQSIAHSDFYYKYSLSENLVNCAINQCFRLWMIITMSRSQIHKYFPLIWYSCL